MKTLNCAALLSCLLVVGVIGCKGAPEQHDFAFDRHGWGGPDLKYTIAPVGNVIKIESGMLVNKSFRWADSEFSFEFLDNRDLVWGFRLLDLVLRPTRRRELRSQQTLVKLGPKRFVSGSRLPPGELWRLWKFDLVLDLAFVHRQKGVGYKILAGWWKERFLDNGGEAVQLEGGHDVRMRRNDWNTFCAKVTRGKLTYTLNGRPGSGWFQVDLRTNGQLGIFVHQGGPLYIRNVRLGPPEPEPAQ